MIKMQPEMSEQTQINRFHSLFRKGALQTFEKNQYYQSANTQGRTGNIQTQILTPVSQAKTKHTWHRLVFDPKTMKLPDFLEELNQSAENAFEQNAQNMIDSLLYAKLLPKQTQSTKMAILENG